MNLYDIPILMVEIRDLIESGQTEGLEERVALLTSEGPKAINWWCDAIKELDQESAALAERIGQLKAKKEAKDNSVERMREMLRQVLNSSFDGKVKTAEYTCFTRKGKPTTKYKLKEGRTIKDLPSTCWKIDLDAKVVKDMLESGMVPEAIETWEEPGKESVVIK